MLIRFKIQGGLAFMPAKAAEHVLDSAKLPHSQAAALKHALEQVHFFERSESAVGGNPQARDTRTYTISAEDAGRRKTLVVHEPVPSELRDLVALLRELTTASRTA
jgi:hypothetical protein